MPNYLFFDIDPDLLEAYARELGRLDPDSEPRVRVLTVPTDVRSLAAAPGHADDNGDRIDVFVSPANSFGWMDGGIDGIYSEMWPGVGPLVQKEIARRSPYATVYGRAALPVGGALLVSLAELGHPDVSLVCAPTMFHPQNINNKRHQIYWAMYAVLRACEHLDPEITVGVPGMGTGVGGVSGADSALEVLRAFIDVQRGSSPRYPPGSSVRFEEPGTYLLLPSN